MGTQETAEILLKKANWLARGVARLNSTLANDRIHTTVTPNQD